MKKIHILIIAFVLLHPVYQTFSQSTLCEQFESITFPPTGWTVQFAGSLYWMRSTQSAYHNGVGSAFYDMWDAPNGTNQSLITLVFPATGAGDSLIVDMSYVNPGSSSDSLIILVSTDGGGFYFSQARLGQVQFTTCVPPCNEMIWRTHKFGLPTGTDRIQFLGKSGFGNALYLDNICIQPNPLGVANNNNTVSQYSLEQNYPNPFNPSTNIKYSIPKPGIVRITIIDALGREIKILVNDFKPAGSYSIDFDGTDMASGLYLYKIEAGGFTQSKKMLLVK